MSRAKKAIMQIRQDEIAAEKANLVNQAQGELEKVVAQDAMEQENPKQWLEDVTQHGCQSGMVPGMIYYNETGAFYDQHEDEIWEALYNEAEAQGAANPLALISQFNGADNVGNGAQFKNLLAWWAYEHSAYNLLTRVENES